MKYQVCFVLTKPANFEQCAWKKLLRSFAKQKDGGILQVTAVIEQSKAFKHVFGGSVSLTIRNTLCLYAFFQEVVYGFAVDILQCSMLVSDVIPRTSHLLQ